MAREGMDVDAVEAIGRQLQSLADQIKGLQGQIASKVHQLPSLWEGKDAQVFVNDWWPQHQKALQAAADAVHGLGQSALSNASEQRQVSSR